MFNIKRISKGEMPPENNYVLIYCSNKPWFDPSDQANVYWKVAKMVRGISFDERLELLNSGDPGKVIRANQYHKGDMGDNNAVAYIFEEFGPSSWFGQDIEYWCELPNIKEELTCSQNKSNYIWQMMQ